MLSSTRVQRMSAKTPTLANRLLGTPTQSLMGKMFSSISNRDTLLLAEKSMTNIQDKMASLDINLAGQVPTIRSPQIVWPRAGSGLSFGSNKVIQPFSVYSRAFTASAVLASKRTIALTNLKKEFGVNYGQRTVPTKPLLSALRDMQSHRALTNARQRKWSLIWKTESNDYRDGLRACQTIAGWEGRECKPFLTIAELEQVISPENGVSWRLVYDIVKTGSCSDLDQCSAEEKAMIQFNRIHGIGPQFAKEFVAAGAKTIDDLQHSMLFIGKNLTKAQALGIQHREEMEIMIPRAEVEQFYDIIKTALIEVPRIGFEFMGSFRRGEAMTSDIDLIVHHESHQHKTDLTHDLMPKVRDALFKAGILTKEKLFQDGPKKVAGLGRLPNSTNGEPALYRQFDIRLCPRQSLYYMLLGNTGDDELMKILRKQANIKGWSLNEYVMGDKPESLVSTEAIPGTEILVNSEEEIFNLLEVPYLPPTQRSFRQYSEKLAAFIGR